MKILIFSQYYYPEQFLINEIAPEMVRQGHKVTVITGLPNYPSGIVPKEYQKGKLRYEIQEGVEIIRCPIIPRGKNKIQLLLNYISYMFSAYCKAKRLKEDYDIVVSYQLTPIFQVVPAIKYAKRKKLKLLLYNLDLAPMSGSMYVKKSNCLYEMYKKTSSWIMNKCDYIAVTSKSFILYNHETNNVPFEKMIYLPQHASNKMEVVYQEKRNDDIVNFMFAGNIAVGTGIDTVVEAAKQLKKEVVFKVHIVGEGSYLKSLKKKVEQANLSNEFVFHGRFPMSEMPKIYGMADALLITLRPGQITIPGKLQTYMTTKKPIFGAMDGSGNELINETGCGVCVNSGESAELYKVMKDYILNPQKYEQCGEKGYQYYINNFTLDIFVARLNEIINSII